MRRVFYGRAVLGSRRFVREAGGVEGAPPQRVLAGATPGPGRSFSKGVASHLCGKAHAEATYERLFSPRDAMYLTSIRNWKTFWP